MFSRIYDRLDAQVRSILDGRGCPSWERTAEILEKACTEAPGLAELAALLEIGADPDGGAQFRMLRSFTERRFRKPEGNRVRYIAPIYLSSYCVDTCGYCNFSAARRGTARKRLGLADLEEEMAAVLASSSRVIELVLGTDADLPWPVLAGYVARTAELLRGETGSAVLLCSDYLPAEAYVMLREAGLWGMIQWDETFDRRAYHRWHATSPRKWDLETRMDNHDRALAAGVEVATGALFGLADFRYEVLMQVAKARFLEGEYGRKPFAFGTARLKPIGGRELRPAAEVSDRAYETALMVYKIAEPAVGRWLQTRETFELNLRNMLDGDAFTYRCGEVRPGGHHDSAISAQTSPGGQFAVQELTREVAEEELRKVSFRIDHAWIGSGSPKELARLPAG